LFSADNYCALGSYGFAMREAEAGAGRKKPVAGGGIPT
jgi:hypothetical protein